MEGFRKISEITLVYHVMVASMLGIWYICLDDIHLSVVLQFYCQFPSKQDGK